MQKLRFEQNAKFTPENEIFLYGVSKLKTLEKLPFFILEGLFSMSLSRKTDFFPQTRFLNFRPRRDILAV